MLTEYQKSQLLNLKPNTCVVVQLKDTKISDFRNFASYQHRKHERIYSLEWKKKNAKTIKVTKLTSAPSRGRKFSKS